MTAYTEKTIPHIIRDLGKDHAVVGTLSEGCDQTVCMNALKYGVPFIEILPCGLSQTYPSGSRSLRRFLLSNGGLVLTEFLPKERAGQGNFLRRSRIIGGISYVTIVLQAGAESGALNTAEYSSAPLFVPPNNIFSPEYAGVVKAVRKGAGLYLGNEDIAASYAQALKNEKESADIIPETDKRNHFKEPAKPHKKSAAPGSKKENGAPDAKAVKQTVNAETANSASCDADAENNGFESSEQSEVYELIKSGGRQVSLEELIAAAGRTAAELSEILLDLEIAGKITSSGNRYSIVS